MFISSYSALSSATTLFILLFLLPHSIFTISDCLSSHQDLYHSLPLNLHSEIIHNGFHPFLKYTSTLHLSSTQASLSSTPPMRCDLAIVNYLSPGVFIDPFEISDRMALHAINISQQFFYPTMDLELPSYLSPSHVVVSIVPSSTTSVYSAESKEKHVNSQLSQLGQVDLQWELILPLHARYQLPSHSESFVPIDIESPQLYLNCPEGLTNLLQITKKETSKKASCPCFDGVVDNSERQEGCCHVVPDVSILYSNGTMGNRSVHDGKGNASIFFARQGQSGTTCAIFDQSWVPVSISHSGEGSLLQILVPTGAAAAEKSIVYLTLLTSLLGAGLILYYSITSLP